MKRRTVVQWQALFKAHAESGQTAAVFCREHKLCQKYFSLRKKQLGWREENAFITAQSQQSQEAFVPVAIQRVAQSKCALHATSHLRLSYHQAQLDLPISVDAIWLGHLMRALA